MLLELENTSKENLNILLAFAKQQNLKLTLVDENAVDSVALPGKPLTEIELTDLIMKSRKSGIISMQDAHKIIRTTFNAG